MSVIVIIRRSHEIGASAAQHVTQRGIGVALST